jgi:hypothetical protein
MISAEEARKIMGISVIKDVDSYIENKIYPYIETAAKNNKCGICLMLNKHDFNGFNENDILNVLNKKYKYKAYISGSSSKIIDIEISWAE